MVPRSASTDGAIDAIDAAKRSSGKASADATAGSPSCRNASVDSSGSMRSVEGPDGRELEQRHPRLRDVARLDGAPQHDGVHRRHEVRLREAHLGARDVGARELHPGGHHAPLRAARRLPHRGRARRHERGLGLCECSACIVELDAADRTALTQPLRSRDRRAGLRDRRLGTLELTRGHLLRHEREGAASRGCRAHGRARTEELRFCVAIIELDEQRSGRDPLSLARVHGAHGAERHARDRDPRRREHATGRDDGLHDLAAHRARDAHDRAPAPRPGEHDGATATAIDAMTTFRILLVRFFTMHRRSYAPRRAERTSADAHAIAALPDPRSTVRGRLTRWCRSRWAA